MKNIPENNVPAADLIDPKNPDAVLEEIIVIFSAMFDTFDEALFKAVFIDIIRLYNGDYPGYQKCSTDYHDLPHTIDVLLAMARLIHGFSQSDFTFCKNCIDCTDITTDPAKLVFSSHEEEVVAMMLGITDLIGQMADRNYLEKLVYLYYEFEEGNVPGFESELDLIHKTIGFFAFSEERTTATLGNMEKHMMFHFIERWSIHEDLYRTAIEKNKQYLHSILSKTTNNLHVYLRRNGILEYLRNKNIFSRITRP